MLEKAGLQGRSDDYWKRAQTTYLASAEYYDKQEAELRSILRALPRSARLADVGCGDGRYTIAAKDYADAAFGWDFSEGLIAQARLRAESSGSAGVTFEVGSFAEAEKGGPFNVLLCLGVLSALFTEDAFNRALRSMRASLSVGETLVTKDTLSLGLPFHSEQGDYVAFYRSKQEYLRAFEQLGFTLREQRELTKATEKTQNSFYVFSVTPRVD